MTSKSKVYDGTRAGDDATLCATCRNCLVIVAHRMGDDRMICRAMNPQQHVPVKVVQCSEYDDRREPSRWDFEQTAWILTSSPSRKAGFVTPLEWRGYPNNE